MEKKEHWEKEWEITPVYNQVSFIKYLLDKAREEVRIETLKEVGYTLAKDTRYEFRFTEIKEVLSKLKDNK